MENDFSAIRSIQELKNLLDSGAITQQEFDALKRKIIFGSNQPEPTPDPVTPPTSWSIPTNIEKVTPRAIESDPINNQSRDSYANLNDTPAPPRNIDAIGPDDMNEGGDLADTKRKDWLLTILISLGVLLLLVLIGFQLFNDQDSERLTSKSGPDREEIVADTTAASTSIPTPETTQADKIEVVADTASLPAATTTPTTETAPIVTEATPASTAQPAPTPAVSDEDALSRIKDRLESYYDDMKAAPFSAQRHFAPTVERYYTLSNTTPAAINENINTYHFPEFVDSQTSIEDNSLKLTANEPDGYEVTYIEHGSALRKSKGQKQETTARVRARFNQDFKMTYFRQEQLLENKFVE
jgi:hypothetical protein